MRRLICEVKDDQQILYTKKDVIELLQKQRAEVIAIGHDWLEENTQYYIKGSVLPDLYDNFVREVNEEWEE